MGQEMELEAYRSQLLESRSNRPGRSIRGRSDFIQVYLNERRVGELEGARIETTLHVNGVDHIETVQLRTEDGRLLGGLVAPESGFRTSRIRLSSDTIELCVHNMAQGGSLNAVFIPAPSFWSRTWKTLAGVIDSVTIRRSEAPLAYGMRTVAFTQVLLAIAVVGLVADRTALWTTPQHASSPVVAEVLPVPTTADMAKLEQQLGELARMQEKVGEALESQQKGMVQLHQVMAKLSSTQESVVSSVVMVKEEVKEELEKRFEVASREAERTTRHLATKGRVEQDQLEAAIRHITSDNDRLSKEVANLEENNQTLKTKLQSAVLSASKAVDPNPERLMVRQADIGRQNPSLHITDAQQGTSPQPFLFWVTFSEGTSQESIDQWVNQMKGHKGAVNEGWQEVQILPPPVPPDRFLEQIKEEKIVKEARLNH